MGKKGLNGESFYAYRENPQPREVYFRNGKPTPNSGKTIVCRTCGETKSAVASRSGSCKPCHQAKWRTKKGLPPIEDEVYGNSYRTIREGIPPAYKHCQSCRVLKHMNDFRLATVFECPRIISSSTCRECRVAKKTLPLIRRDKEFLKDFLGRECGVCQDPVAGKNAHIDHCHSTGEIRGQLCNRCNLALGLLRDREDLILSLKDYIVGSRVRR